MLALQRPLRDCVEVAVPVGKEGFPTYPDTLGVIRLRHLNAGRRTTTSCATGVIARLSSSTVRGRTEVLPRAMAEHIHNLKRKRARERSNISRFASSIHSFTEGASRDDFEQYKGRLEEALEHMLKLDDTIHDLLTDEEYDADVTTCEEYIDTAKRAIQRAGHGLEKFDSAAPDNLTPGQTPPLMNHKDGVSIPSLSHHVKLPPLKLEPFSGDIEGWARFWEQFESSIDKDPSLSVVNKHVFLRGYLEGEPKMLVEGIAVVADTYAETKRILLARYGDKNRIIQAHLDYLENVRPIQYPTPDALNTAFIECHRRIQALRALGEDVNGYGRVIAPKILRAFPDDLCRRWIVHAKREGLSEGDILSLMTFLGEEVDGALTTQKIRGEVTSRYGYTPTAAALHVQSKSRSSVRRVAKDTGPFCVFCENRGHWAQDCERVVDITERIEKLKKAHRCFLCLSRGHTSSNCRKKGRVQCTRCRRPHHQSLCDKAITNTSVGDQNNVTAVGKVDVDTPAFTYLQTARVRITGPTGLSRITRCVLDGGSQSSFITNTWIEDLKLRTIEH